MYNRYELLKEEGKKQEKRSKPRSRSGRKTIVVENKSESLPKRSTGRKIVVGNRSRRENNDTGYKRHYSGNYNPTRRQNRNGNVNKKGSGGSLFDKYSNKRNVRRNDNTREQQDVTIRKENIEEKKLELSDSSLWPSLGKQNYSASYGTIEENSVNNSYLNMCKKEVDSETIKQYEREKEYIERAKFERSRQFNNYDKVDEVVEQEDYTGTETDSESDNDYKVKKSSMSKRKILAGYSSPNYVNIALNSGYDISHGYSDPSKVLNSYKDCENIDEVKWY